MMMMMIKYYNIENLNCACCFMWVTDSVFHVIRRFRLKVFAYRMLKKILRPKRKEGRKEGGKEQKDEENRI